MPLPETTSASDLDGFLGKIITGDANAFGRWAAHAEPTLRLTLKQFAKQVDVEAVLQETLLRVWQVAPRFRPDGRPNGLFRLAVRMARNLALNEARRLNPGQRVDVPGSEDEVMPALPDPALRSLIEGCREQLPAKPGLALAARLTASGCRSDEEVATGLGMRVNTFLQNLTRARRLLLECLKRHRADLPGALP